MDFEERIEKRVKEILRSHHRTRDVPWEDVRDIMLPRAERLRRPLSKKAREDLKAYLDLARPSQWFKRIEDDDRKLGRYGIELDLIGEVKWLRVRDTLDVEFLVSGVEYAQWEPLARGLTLPWRKAWGDPSPKKECLLDEAESVFLISQISPKPQSLFSLWGAWRDRISPDRLRSKDKEWIDQVMVSYAIKHAQKGDNDARERLCRCYSPRLKSLVEGFCSTKRISGDDWSDVHQRAELLLRVLIAGDTPPALLDILEDWLEAGGQKQWAESTWAGTAMLKAPLYWIELLIEIEVREAQLVYQSTSPDMVTLQEVLKYRIEHGLEKTIDMPGLWQPDQKIRRLWDDPAYQLEVILSESAEMMHTAHLLKDDPVAAGACYDLREPGTLTTYLFGIEGEKEGILWHRLRRWYDQFYRPHEEREVSFSDLSPQEQERLLGERYED